MTSISSRPRCPPSPAWGFRPQTRMRGCAMPKRERRSRSRVRRVRVRPSVVMAWLTRLSGRWVVARATRSPGATSIITGSAPQRAARNSVWPVEGHARVVDDPLVHRARDQGVEEPGQAAIAGDLEGLDHIGRRWPVSRCPGRDRAADGDRVDQEGPGPLRGRGGARDPSGSGSGAAPGRRRAVAADPGPPPPPVRSHGRSGPGAHRGPGRSRRAPPGSGRGAGLRWSAPPDQSFSVSMRIST